MRRSVVASEITSVKEKIWATATFLIVAILDVLFSQVTGVGWAAEEETKPAPHTRSRLIIATNATRARRLVIRKHHSLKDWLHIADNGRNEKQG